MATLLLLHSPPFFQPISSSSSSSSLLLSLSLPSVLIRKFERSCSSPSTRRSGGQAGKKKLSFCPFPNGINDAAETRWLSALAVPLSAARAASSSAEADPPSEQRRQHRIFKEAPGGSRVLAESDVVIVGAGIIGLAIANRLLTETHFSVTVVDAKQPCAGASGAGQGYVWLGHMQPQDQGWPLAYRSKQIWEDLAAQLRASGVDPLSAIGWKNTGSMVVADTQDKASKLRNRVEVLQKAGAQIEYLDAVMAKIEEPAISIEASGGAAFAPEDSQIDAKLATLFLQERNRGYCGQGRYSELFHNAVTNFIFSSADRHIGGVQTSQGLVYSKEAVVVAAGSWTGSVMQTIAEEHDLPLVPSIKPRKGHLLVLEGIPNLRLNHGLMEAGYKEHAEPSIPTQDCDVTVGASSLAPDDLGIAMTATIDSRGSLLLGSSRQFVGFDENPADEVVEHILHRAAEFLPALRAFSTCELRERTTVRIGFRPYISDEKPILGAVPGVSGFFLASGHEGSGLTMAPATAEMVCSMIRGASLPLDPTPFLPSGRLSRLQS